jgi:hypothetical protein
VLITKSISVLIATGRVYISRDVIFYESVFPFSKLHPNTGACLRLENFLLPSSLVDCMLFGINVDVNRAPKSIDPTVHPCST